MYHGLRVRCIGRAGDLLMAHPIGLAHLSAMELEPAALIDLAADTGHASVALRLHSAAAGTPVYPMVPGSVETLALRDYAHSRGVAISEIELVPITHNLAPDTLRPLLQVAKELGATGLIVTGDIDDRALLIDRFAAICKNAAAHGLLVHLEFMRWRAVGTLSDAREVVAQSEQHNARILVDLLHLARSGGTAEELATLPPDLVNLVQICDATAELQGDIIAEARGGRLMPGQGALPIPDMLSALRGTWNAALELPGMGEGDARRTALAEARAQVEKLCR